MSQPAHNDENLEKKLARNEPSPYTFGSERTDLKKRTVGTSREKHIVTATGETVTEVSPAMSYFRVHDIMEQLTAGFERKSTTERIAQAKELAATSGINTDTSELEAALAKPTELEQRDAEASEDFEKSVYTYLRKLAEDIVDALNQHKRSLAVIEAESIGERTTDRIGIRGDVNFVINKQAGQELVQSLQSQHNPMKVRRKNEYGFVLWNKDLNLHMVFVYQEGLGQVKTEQEPDLSQYQDLDTATTETQPSSGEAANTPTPATEAEHQTQAAAADLDRRRGEVTAAQQKLTKDRTLEVGSFAVDSEDRQHA